LNSIAAPMKRLDLIALLLVSIAGARCGGEECDGAPVGFELVVTAPDMDQDVQTISVLLAIDEEKWTRSFELGDTFRDGETSLYVAIEPAPEVEFDAALLVEGYSGSGRMTARGSGRFLAQPDGCNRFRVELESVRRGVKGHDDD
jgi:hypothetical protein